MIVETSALIAILFEEDDAEKFRQAIASAPVRRMSAANYVEAGIVIDSQKNPLASGRVVEFLTRASIEIEGVTASQAKIARQAYRDFGKGSGHPAKLNFGDCFAFALAVETGEPLLYKGDDFTHTGINPV